MEQRSKGRRRIWATKWGKGMKRRQKRLRVSSEVVLTQLSIEEMYFAVDDEVAKVGDITEKSEVRDEAGAKNDVGNFVK